MRALVTGASGFLGQVIAKKLLPRGDEVHSIARSQYPMFEAMGVTMLKGDIGDLDTVIRSMEGCDIVFHVASKAGGWGSYHEYHHCNVYWVTKTSCAPASN